MREAETIQKSNNITISNSRPTDAVTTSMVVLPGLDRTAPHRLRAVAQRQPTRTALSFVDYDSDRNGRVQHLTFAELDSQVTSVAAVLAAHARPGERVAILTPQSMDYLVGFLGALRAGVVAVPLFSPDLPGHGGRLTAVLADCAPVVALASRRNAALVRDTVGASVDVLAVGDIVDVSADGYRDPDLDPDDVAYLQYTSGSTRSPAGVKITHANFVANTIQAVDAYGVDKANAEIVSWLPLFHDMGLTLVAGGCASRGIPATFMDPIAFLMKPARWLQCLSRPVETISMAPNFAYAFCASRVSDDDLATLDLSCVKTMVNGAEPVDLVGVAAFTERFAAAGLAPTVVRPSYGLAEATCYVSGHNDAVVARHAVFDRDALTRGQARAPIDDIYAVTLASCGRPTGQLVAIADYTTGTRRADGEVGEIWVHGPNVAAGYWNNEELSGTQFGQALLEAGDLPGSGWLRTGDLGVLVGGELYVTGRITDLIIIDGRNHYPHDIEATVEAASPVVGRHRVAAFALAGEGGESAAVVTEVSRRAGDDWDERSTAQQIRAAVSRAHGIALSAVLFVAADQVPRTSSGKVARAATREQFLAGNFVVAKPSP